MNERVFPNIAEFDCRSCGSKFQKQSNNVKFCASCWGEFERWIKQMNITDRSALSVNRWMARRLMLDAERLTRYGITGRCEAVSTAGSRRWLGGFDAQCRLRATTKRDGRQVCERHSMATSPVFVGEEMHDPYTDLTRVLTHLANTDELFRECLVSALSSQTRDTP